MSRTRQQDGGDDENRFRALLEGAGDALLELDGRFEIRYASPRSEEILGFAVDDLAGRPFLEFLHPEDRPSLEDALRTLLRNDTNLERLVRGVDRAGESRWLAIGARAMKTPRGRRHIVLSCRDASDRLQALTQSRARDEAEERVRELSRRFLALGANEFDSAIQECLEAAAQVIHSDRAYLISFVTNSLRQHHRAFEWNKAGLSERGYDFSQGSVRRYDWVWKQLVAGELVRIPRFDDAPPEAAETISDLRSFGIKSYLAIPVRSDGRVLGIMGFHNVEAETDWSEPELALLRLIAELITSALRRQRAENRLRASEARFRALAENARDGIIEIGSDGALRYSNPGFGEITGLEPEELKGALVSELIFPESEGEPAGDSSMLGKDVARPMLFRVAHQDGSPRWVEMTRKSFTGDDGQPCSAAVVRDVTNRERRQRQIRERRALEVQIGDLSRHFLALRAEQIDDAIVASLPMLAKLAGAEHAWLLHIEPGLGESAGGGGHLYRPDGHRPVDPGRQEDRKFRDHHPWAYAQLCEGKVLHVPNREELPDEAGIEKRSMRENGVVSALAVPLRAGEDMIGILGFDADSELRSWSDEMIGLLRLCGDLFLGALSRKRAESALLRSQRTLIQSQKMEAVGTLAGGIAHDFNNQLSVILGNARFIQQSLPESWDLVDALADLERAGEHCARLTRSLLAFSRHSAQAPEPVEVGRVFSDVRQLLGPLIPASIQFEMSAHDGSESVVVDPVQLQQVLVHLAINARDAMPGGGTLEISTARQFVDEAGAQRLGLESPGSYLAIAVRDDGIGMDDEVQSRAFDPFYTTKGPGQGTGLGLAMVYGSVHEWGGSVSVESTPGEGTTFRVFLPRVDVAHGRGPSRADDAAFSGNETVLVVEDEARVRRLLVRMLSRRGYDVLEAEDGQQALALSRSHDGPIHALVSDLIMPRMGGFDLATALIAERPQLRVLFQSGYSNDSADVPGSRFLQKPFSEAELIETLRALLDVKAA